MMDGDNVRPDERVSRPPSRPARPPARRSDASWLVARSAGEILSLAALVLSVVAIFVVLDDANAPGLLRDQAILLITRIASQAHLVAILAAGLVCALVVMLVLAVRRRDEASSRATRLARELGDTRRQVEQLRATLRARDEQLLAVVHELRTPLTHVVGYAELLSSGARPRHTAEIGEMSGAIQSASMTMLRLMDDLVAATRAQSEGFELKKRPVDLAHLIRGVVAGYDAQPRAHRLAVDLPDHWLAVLADPERIHQILANLLTNAISYSPSGGDIYIRARQVDSQVRVEIEDHGIGMTPEDQQRAFDRFYRSSQGRAIREQGSGLGLAIVKDLVEAHGGHVGVRSVLGVGSTFWFSLPAADERTIGSEAPAMPPRAVSLTQPS